MGDVIPFRKRRPKGEIRFPEDLFSEVPLDEEFVEEEAEKLAKLFEEDTE